MCGLPLKRCMRVVQLKNCSMLNSNEPAAFVWNAALASSVSWVHASQSVTVQVCKAVQILRPQDCNLVSDTLSIDPGGQAGGGEAAGRAVP